MLAKKTIIKRTMKLFEGASIELTAMVAADNVVNGYIDIVPDALPALPPVQMPVETAEGQPREEGKTNGTPPAGAEPPDQPDAGGPTDAEGRPLEEGKTEEPPSEPEEGANVATVTLGAVLVKNGKNAKGPWEKFSSQGSDGEWYGTFDTKLGKLLYEAAESGGKYVIEFNESKYGRDIVTIEVE